MADKLRWKYGDTKPIQAAVDSATVIEIGDALWQDTDDAKPASDVTYLSTLAQTQESFHDDFLGIAAQRSRNGDTDDIRVNTGGVHEFPCASQDWELGDFVGMDDNAAPDALLNQQVIKVATANLAIGRCKSKGTGLTKILVEIESVVITGGPQAAA